MTKIIICKNCNEPKLHHAKGLCDKCYKIQYNKDNPHNRCNYNHRVGKSQPYNENKQCSSYLGVHIAEQVLSKVFKNVKVMPNGNPGYDFICNGGYKIDVKSGCRMKNRKNSWSFYIKQNKTCDYFLLLSFDNRKDLNPLHIWLIPGNIINNKIGIIISESNISKWDKYKLNINKVINQCNNIRGD